MLKLHKQTVVKAPVERVFGFVEQPTNLPQIWPSLYEVKEIETIPAGGYRFSWFYNMLGKPIHGTTETFRFEDGKLIVDKTKGDVEATFTWKFTGHNGTTEVSFDAEYEPKVMFPKEDMTFFARRNEIEADAILANLKARFEV
jgi:ligand-binding SRPBCC domain-containing protein